MLHGAEVKLGQKQQRPRIYFENKVRLTDSEFLVGKHFYIKVEKNQITLFLDENGDRTVSKRQRKATDEVSPVIDINTSDILNAFDRSMIGGMLYARYYKNKIVITLKPCNKAVKEREERLSKRLKSGQTLEKVSLFTGSGFLDNAIDSGFSQAGVDVKTVFANELEEPYLTNGLENNPSLKGAVSVQGSIAFLHHFDIPQADIITAGSPCVGLSNAGKASNGITSELDHEDAGHLFIYMLNAILRVNPAICILENSPNGMESTTFSLIQRVLEENGYKIQKTVINSRHFGGIEERKRMAFIAVSEGIEFDLSMLEETGVSDKTVSDYLDSVIDDSLWSPMEHIFTKFEKDKELGRNFKPNIVTENANRVGTFGRGYQRNRSTETKLEHPTKLGLYRLFTPTEHIRMKDFHPDMIKGLSKTVAHEVLGNGVDSHGFKDLGKEIARQVIPMINYESQNLITESI